MDERPLRAVADGELDPDAPQTYAAALAMLQETQRQLSELNRKYLGALSQIGNLRADKAEEAAAHPLWDIAVTLFMEWKVASGANRKSGTNRAKWTAERFWICQPYLKERGFPMCRAAVWGISAHPNRREITPDYWEVYDGWELAFGSSAKFERYANRGAAIFGMKWLSTPAI